MWYFNISILTRSYKRQTEVSLLKLCFSFHVQFVSCMQESYVPLQSLHFIAVFVIFTSQLSYSVQDTSYVIFQQPALNHPVALHPAASGIPCNLCDRPMESGDDRCRNLIRCSGFIRYGCKFTRQLSYSRFKAGQLRRAAIPEIIRFSPFQTTNLTHSVEQPGEGT